MKDTKTILAMLAKAREDILEEKSSKSKTGDAFVVYMKKKGERCGKEVFAYNWNGNRDNIEALFDATQIQGWYITKVSKRCRWSNYTDMTIYLEQSADGFTTNVDVDVIDALKEMTTMMTNFTPDPKKIEDRLVEKTSRWGYNLVNCIESSRYGNDEWYIDVEGEPDYFNGYGYDGAIGAYEYLADKAKTHRIFSWRAHPNGLLRINLRKMTYNMTTNLTPDVLERMEKTVHFKGIA